MPAPSQVDGEFAGQYPLRILVIDDHDINRRLLTIMLKNLGYEPESRSSGREGYEAAMEEPFDLILTDIDMPEMSGIECARALRAAGLDLPIMAVTATAADEARADCMHAGMSDFMRKPIALAELKRVLREVALRKWLEQANRVIVER